MERTVQFRIDREKIATIDAIYISHAHTDHLDPYTLVSLFDAYRHPEQNEGSSLVNMDSSASPQNDDRGTGI